MEVELAAKGDGGIMREDSTEDLGDTMLELFLSLRTGREGELAVDAEVGIDGEEEAFEGGPRLPWPVKGTGLVKY